MLKKTFFIGAVLSSLFFISADYTNYLDWSSKKLQFTDFKGKIPTTGKIANFAYEWSWGTTNVQGKAPQYALYNQMNQDLSWIKKKTPEVLLEKQIQFDLAELYTRKARKELNALTQKGEKNSKAYTNVIEKYSKKLHKREETYNAVLYEQPAFMKIITKEISDSLKLYAQFYK